MASMMNETIEQQMKDSDIIFTAISTGDFDDFKQAQQAVVMLYVTDMSYSRSGISHALKRLEKHYTTMNDDDFDLTEEEQRFENMLDGIEEEYDELIREEEERFLKDSARSLIYMGIALVGIVALVVAGFYFDLYTVS